MNDPNQSDRQKKSESRQLGIKGEEIARNYLEKIGYRFLDKNFNTEKGEIDLIFMDGDTLVFVEVKTRSYKYLINIEETISKIKINKILKSAEIYIDSKQIAFEETRIDAIYIIFDNKEYDIQHEINII